MILHNSKKNIDFLSLKALPNMISKPLGNIESTKYTVNTCH